MSYFAKVVDGTVIEVMITEQKFIDSGAAGDPASWVETSYNTRGGIYYDSDSRTPSSDQSRALRKNFAEIGYTYDATRDAFIPPKPYSSWVLDENTCFWNAPTPYPSDSHDLCYWDENSLSWKNS